MRETFSYFCPKCRVLGHYKSQSDKAPKVIRTTCGSCKKPITLKKYDKIDDLVLEEMQKSEKQKSEKEIDRELSTDRFDVVPSNILRNRSENQVSVKTSEHLKKNNENTLSKSPGILSSETADLFECHCIRFKIPLLKTNPYFRWDSIKKMKNWTKKLYYQSDFNLELTTQHVIINISKLLYGKNFNQLLAIAERFAWDICGWLELQGFKLGSKMEQVQKPHIVFPETFSPELRSKGANFLISGNGFVIDDSKETGNGEIEYVDQVEKLNEIMNLPDSLKELTKCIVKQQQIITTQQNQIQELIGISKETKKEPKSEVEYFT